MPNGKQKSDLYNYDGDFERKGVLDFLLLPSEIRTRIYFLNWFGASDADKFRKPYPPLSASDRGRLNLTLVSRRLHDESTHYLYSTTTFRLFPLQDFQFLPTPLHLPPHYRSHITSISLIVGSSWTNPPKDWKVGKAVRRCLGRMKVVRRLKVFIEIDPSIPMFAKYRISESFYTNWCGDLLKDVLEALTPNCEVVEMDGNPSVDQNGPLSTRLTFEVEESGRKVVFGPEWSARPATMSPQAQLDLMSGNDSLGGMRILTEGMQSIEITA